jgi:uncharacterized cofD-like protein
MKKIVVIGGGTGIFNVLQGLKDYPYKISAVVSMADDGGSTGFLREEFGILPPGDIRRALIALSSSDKKILSELFNYRFQQGKGLAGHSLGNLLLTALERICGNFGDAVKEACRILNVRGNVIPVTLEKTRLYARLENGVVIKGETNIDIPKHDGRLRISDVFLKPKVHANPEAREAILEADFVVLGPGDIFTSLIPNLLVLGIKEALEKSHARLVYILNIMTKFGETYKFAASDFIKTIEKYLGKKRINYCIVNTQRPQEELLSLYRSEQDEPVVFDKENFPRYIRILEGRFLRRGRFLRHDPKKLAAKLAKLFDTV